jgi:predicted type IV restriction endonuclease
VNYLVAHLKYPRSLIKIEGGLTYNQLAKRSDIVVHDRDGKAWMLVECKAPEVKLSEQAVRQAAMYNSKLGARYIAVSNGLSHVICEVDLSGIQILTDLPVYQD